MDAQPSARGLQPEEGTTGFQARSRPPDDGEEATTRNHPTLPARDLLRVIGDRQAESWLLPPFTQDRSGSSNTFSDMLLSQSFLLPPMTRSRLDFFTTLGRNNTVSLARTSWRGYPPGAR